MKFKYASESPFWYFLARRTFDNAQQTVPSIFDVLNERAHKLELPIVYKIPQALTWAVACQLFIVTQQRSDIIGRIGFSVMLTGFDHVLGPKGFAEIAFTRILENIKSPAFQDRKKNDSIVDTFLANGLKLMDEKAIDSSLDQIILEACLSDEKMLFLGKDVCRPSSDLWDSTVTEYTNRRPGVFRRNFTDPNKWLYD